MTGKKRFTGTSANGNLHLRSTGMVALRLIRMRLPRQIIFAVFSYSHSYKWKSKHPCQRIQLQHQKKTIQKWTIWLRQQSKRIANWIYNSHRSRTKKNRLIADNYQHFTFNENLIWFSRFIGVRMKSSSSFSTPSICVTNNETIESNNCFKKKSRQKWNGDWHKRVLQVWSDRQSQHFDLFVNLYYLLQTNLYRIIRHGISCHSRHI